MQCCSTEQLLHTQRPRAGFYVGRMLFFQTFWCKLLFLTLTSSVCGAGDDGRDDHCDHRQWHPKKMTSRMFKPNLKARVDNELALPIMQSVVPGATAGSHWWRGFPILAQVTRTLCASLPHRPRLNDSYVLLDSPSPTNEHVWQVTMPLCASSFEKSYHCFMPSSFNILPSIYLYTCNCIIRLRLPLWSTSL